MSALHAAVVLLATTAVRADWVNEMRLTLANYALSKATNPPNGFICSQEGTKHNSCHCWNDKGKPASKQTEDYCHMPPECLAYQVKSNGTFEFDSIGVDEDLHQKLSGWGVPSEMYSAFDAAVLVESATFVAFNLTVENGGKGAAEAHVGTARKYNDTIQLGWTYGFGNADLVVPHVRDMHACPPGSCHGTSKGMKERGYTDVEIALLNQGLMAYSFKMAAEKAQPAEGSMSEDSFLQKWKGVVTRVDLIEPTTAKDLEKAKMTHIKDAKGSATKPFAMLIEAIEQKKTNATRIKDAVNPFEMLIQAIQQITGAWQSIVNAFKSTYEEQLLDTHLNNGWSKYKQATKVFKGAGLAYDKTDEFFADIQSMINIPDKYKDDFNDQIEWIKFFDNTTWSGHDTQFSQGKGGSDTIFTMYARNREDDGKIDVLFLTCSQEFELADDYFVISEHKSILGGLFDHTKIKFKKKPAAISDKDLMFVSEYFSLLAYQQIALAEGISAPPDPQFPPSLSDLMEAS